MTECVIPLAPSCSLAAVMARRGARILHPIDTTMDLNTFDVLPSGNLFNDSVDFSGTEYFENLSVDGETCQEMTMYLRETRDSDSPTELRTEVREPPEKEAWARPATPQSLTSSPNPTVTVLTVTCEPLDNSNAPTGMSMDMSDITHQFTEISPLMTREFSAISSQRTDMSPDVTQEFPELLPELTDLTQDLPDNSPQMTDMTQEFTEISPQITQEFTENSLQIAQKFSEITPQMTQEFIEISPQMAQEYTEITPQMTQEFIEISPQMAQEYTESSPQMNQNFTQISPQMAQEFPEISPQIAQEFSQISPQINQDFTEISPQMAQEFPEMSPQIAQEFPQISPKLGQDFTEISPQMAQEFPEISPQMPQEFPQISPKMGQDFTEISPQMAQEFPEISPQMNQNFTEISPQMTQDYTEMPSQMTGITQKFTEVSPQMTGMTQNFIEISPQITDTTQKFTEISPQIINLPSQMTDMTPQTAENSPQRIEISPQALSLPAQMNNKTPQFTELSTGLSPLMTDMTLQITDIEPQVTNDSMEVPDLAIQIPDFSLQFNRPQTPGIPTKKIATKIVVLPVKPRKMGPPLKVAKKITLPEMSPKVTHFESPLNDDSMDIPSIEPQITDDSMEMPDLSVQIPDLSLQLNGPQTPGPQSKKTSSKIVLVPVNSRKLLGPPLKVAKKITTPEISPKKTYIEPQLNDDSMDIPSIEPQLIDDSMEIPDLSVQIPDLSLQLNGPQTPGPQSKKASSKIVLLPVNSRKLLGPPLKVAKKIKIPEMSPKVAHIETQLNEDSMDIPSIEPQLTDESMEMPDLSVQIPDLSLQLNGPQTPGPQSQKASSKIVLLPVNSRKLLGPPLKAAKKMKIPEMSPKVTHIETQLNEDSMDIPSIEPQLTDESMEMPDLSVQIPDLSLQLNGPQTPGPQSKEAASKIVLLSVKPDKFLGPPLKVTKKITVPEMSPKVTKIEPSLNDDSMDIPSIEPQLTDDSMEMPDLSVQIPDLSLQLNGPQTPGIPLKKTASKIVLLSVKPDKFLGPPLTVTKKITVPEMSPKVTKIEPSLNDDSMDIPSIEPQLTDDSMEMPDLSVQIPDLSLQLNGPQTPGIPLKKTASQIVLLSVKPDKFLGPPLTVTKKITVPEMSPKVTKIERSLNDDSMDIPSIEPQLTDDSMEMPDLSVQIPDLSLQLNGPQTPGIPLTKTASKIVLLSVKPDKFLGPPLKVAKKITVPEMSPKVTKIESSLNEDSMDIPSIEPQLTDDSLEMPDLSVQIPDLSLQLNGPQTPRPQSKKTASKIVLLSVKPGKSLGPPLQVAKKIIVPDMSLKVTKIEPSLNDDSLDIPSIEPQITVDSMEMPDLSAQIPHLSLQLNGLQTPRIPPKKTVTKIVMLPVNPGLTLNDTKKIAVSDMSLKVTKTEPPLNDDSIDMPSIKPKLTDDSIEIPDLSVQIPDLPLQLNRPQTPRIPPKKTATKIVMLPMKPGKLPGLTPKDSKKITISDMALKVIKIEPLSNDDSMDMPSIKPQPTDDPMGMPDLSVQIPDLSLQLNEPQKPSAQPKKVVTLPTKSRKLRGITLKDAKEISEALSIESQLVHRCDFPGCEKAFAKSSHLVVHKNAHSDDRPYLCWWDGCDWRFARADELSRHVRSKHSAEKRFQCSRCDACFTRSDHLAKHSKKHENGWGGPIKLAPRKPPKKK